MKKLHTFEEFLNEQINEGSRYSIYKKEIEWKQHPKKSGSYVAKSGKSELEILSTGYGNWELKVDGTIVMPSETAKEKSAKDNHTNTFNWANDKVGTLKHTAQEMFESFLNEGKEFSFTFDYNTDEDDIKYIQNILNKAGVNATAEAGLDSEEMVVKAANAMELRKAKKEIEADGFEINK